MVLVPVRADMTHFLSHQNTCGTAAAAAAGPGWMLMLQMLNAQVRVSGSECREEEVKVNSRERSGNRPRGG